MLSLLALSIAQGVSDLPSDIQRLLDGSSGAIFNDDSSTSSTLSASPSSASSGSSPSLETVTSVGSNDRYGLSSSGSSSSSSSSTWTLDDSRWSSSDSDDDDASASSTLVERRLARQERRLAAAVRAALAPPAPTPAPVATKTYQARLRSLDYGASLGEPDTVIEYGPILITSRRNFYLEDGGPEQFYFTTQDFLDTDEDGVPDIVNGIRLFAAIGDSSEYFRILQNRATKASPAALFGRQATGTIDLVQFFQYDGQFSRLNEAVTQCFAVTNDEEFVLEVHVLVSNATGTGGLVSLPTQKGNALLSATTAFVPPVSGEFTDESRAVSADRNLFFDHDLNDFVETFEVSLFANLLPDSHQPDPLPVAREGTIFFEECTRTFSYFA